MSEAATLSDAVLSDRAIMQMVVGGLSGPSLVPVSLEAREAISTPFEIRLEFVSHVPRLAADAFLYRPVLVTLQRNVPAPRYFHGAARRFTTLGPDKRDNWHYAIDIVPQIWFMQQTENCRFFENCSVKDIVSTLLGNIGVGFSFRLHETPAVREYTVQYNETDFAFISRLLEEEGYFYFFQHSPDGHELVIAEFNIAFQTIPDSKLTFRPGQKDYDKLATLHAWTATAVGSVTLGDYDPSGVNKPLPGTEATILGASGASARVVYHWPALAFDTGDVAARARRRIEAAEAFAALSEGESWNEGFVPGGTFTLAEDPLTGQHDTSFVIRNVEHRATSPYRLSASGETSGEIELFYENRFGAFPSTTPWRQPLTVPRPRMAGLYSAVVIGPPGEEIYHDKLARIKVQFPWSHLDDTTPGGALWVRVIKGWAGGGWGTQFIPRIGTEVAVAFIDGDPDRPVVVGGLYNAGSDPLYDPSEKNKTGWRSRSTPGGSQSNYSEVTIDDTIGAERLFLHAERDFVGEVEHDQTLTVDNCRIVSVGQNEQRTIGVNQTTKIGSNEVFTVGANSTRTIGSNYVTKVGVNRTTSVGTDDLLKVGTNRTTTIGADHLLEIGTNQTTTIGTGNTLKVGANQSTTIGAGDMTQVGTNQVLKVGEAQSVTIGTSQSIKVGTAQTVEVGTGQSTTATTGDIALTASTGAIQIAASAGSVGISAAQMIRALGRAQFDLDHADGRRYHRVDGQCRRCHGQLHERALQHPRGAGDGGRRAGDDQLGIYSGRQQRGCGVRVGRCRRGGRGCRHRRRSRDAGSGGDGLRRERRRDESRRLGCAEDEFRRQDGRRRRRRLLQAVGRGRQGEIRRFGCPRGRRRIGPREGLHPDRARGRTGGAQQSGRGAQALSCEGHRRTSGKGYGTVQFGTEERR